MMNKTAGILLSALLLRAGIAHGIDPRAVGQQIQSIIISAAAHHGHASVAAGPADVLPVMAQQGITTQAPQFVRRVHLPESAPAPFNPAQTAAYLAQNHIPTAEQAQEWALEEAQRDRAWQEEVDAKFGLSATDQSSQ